MFVGDGENVREATIVVFIAALVGNCSKFSQNSRSRGQDSGTSLTEIRIDTSENDRVKEDEMGRACSTNG
jgi:hypothetical protein